MSKMKLIDGKVLSQEILEQIHFHSSIDPVLAIIRANDDESSARYIAHKSIQAEELGIRVQGLEFQKGTTATELIKLIDELNSNDKVHGILVQLPLFPELEAD